MTTQETNPPPWHAAYPAPKATAQALPRTELLQWFREGKQAGKDFVLVDVRRTDLEGGTIRGSINLPAQSLVPTLPALYTLFASAGVKHVVWYCGSCSGRGPRAAGWFADHLDERQDTSMQSLILDGGVKGWVKAGGEYVEWMEEFDASKW